MSYIEPSSWLGKVEEQQRHEKNAAAPSRPLFSRDESAKKAGLDIFDSMMATVYNKEKYWWLK